MTELTELQKAGLERLGKKQQRKQYWYDASKRIAYQNGRVDGILIGIGFVSFIALATLIALKLGGY